MKKEFIRPTFDRVLVERIQAVKEVNGILVPDQSQEKPAEGVIVGLGPGVHTEALAREIYKEDFDKVQIQTFELGQKVAFGRYAGKEITINANTPYEQTLTLLKQDEIEAVTIEVEVEDAKG